MHTNNSPFSPRLSVCCFLTLKRIPLAFIQNISTLPLTVCLTVCRPEFMLRVHIRMSSTVTCVPPFPNLGLEPGLSGVIPWKGMTEPQCLEMAALAAISSSKKRAH